MLTFKKLITEIGFTDDEQTEIIAFDSDQKNYGLRDEALSCLLKGDFELLTKKAEEDTVYGMAALVAMLAKAFLGWIRYEQKGISAEIYFDTLSDIRVWAYNYRRVHGKLGLSDLHWVDGSTSLQRFKLGRLQYNFLKFKSDPKYDVPDGLKDGDDLLEIHIQQDGSFNDDLCGESIEAAKNFYREYFPEYDFKGFICHSWLLSPGLSQVLPETSNIIKFGKRFTVIEYQKEDDYQAIERIFDTKFKEKDSKPTSLQLKARKLLDDGGHLGSALGVILID